MKIAVFSDIHNEFSHWKPSKQNVDVVVLAGDVHGKYDGIQWASDNFDVPVIYIPGNHEYYGCEMLSHNRKMKSLAQNTNVEVLINNSVEIDGVLFIGATLWTDFLLYGKESMTECVYEAENHIMDYSKIKIKDSLCSRQIRPADTQLLFEESLAFIDKSVADNRQGKCVVVTHHAPSIRSISPKYNESMLSAGFASNLDDFINERDINLWIHGHTHNSSDYMIGKTCVVSNQRGYPNEENNELFNANFIIEV